MRVLPELPPAPIKLFKYHITCDSKAREIRVSSNIDFEWSHSNLNLE
jgi:hypothetical protein